MLFALQITVGVVFISVGSLIFISSIGDKKVSAPQTYSEEYGDDDQQGVD